MKKLSVFIALIAFFGLSLVNAQTREITGTVTSAEDGLGVIGANVIVKGTTVGVATDIDGNFSINVPEANNVLTFDALGFAPQEITITGSVINVVLKSANIALDEVVVVAYGRKTKAAITGSVKSISPKTIESVPVASFDQILQGQTAGVSSIAASGRPGAAAVVNIRGVGSINAGSEPLYVIDGVPVNSGDFAALNPNDIETMSVLKDATASALYGSRASNGVILVATKRGKAGQAAVVTYRGQYGQSFRSSAKFDMMDTRQRFEFEKKMGNRTGLAATEEALNDLLEKDHKWADDVFRTGQTMSHEVSVRGGSENVKYFVSGSYYNQEGILQRSELDRYTLRVNLDNTVKEWLRFGNSINLGYTESSRTDDMGVNLNSPVTQAYLNLPYEPIYNADGTFNNSTAAGFNVLEQLEKNKDMRTQFKLTGAIFAEVDILKNLTYKANYGIDFYENHDDRYFAWDTPLGKQKDNGQLEKDFNRNSIINGTHTLRYRTSIAKDHDFNVLLGFETTQYERFSMGFDAQNFASEKLMTANAAGNAVSVNGANTQWRNVGMFSNINYSFKKKYFLDLSLRRDGSSRFGKDNRFGNFWSAGGSWAMMKEDFINNLNAFSDLKLRVSVGTSGNASIGNFASLGLYGYGGTSYNDVAGALFTQYANPNLTWEKSFLVNLGLDFGFMNNRLTGSVDVYKKNTTDLIFDIPLSRTSGLTSYTDNVGEMVNQGIEFEFKYEVLRGSDYSWNVGGNFSYNDNEITKLYGGEAIIGSSTIMEEGKAYGSWYLVKFAGVDPSTGKQLWYDKDGKVTDTFDEANKVHADKSYYAPIQGGFSTNFTYKNIDINCMFSYSYGKYILNNNKYFVENSNFSQFNQTTNMENMWTTPGQETNIPKIGEKVQFDDHLLEDASYLRLRNLNIGYTLGKNALNTIKHISSMRVFVQGQNLWTLTKYTGFDPEISGSHEQFSYPVPRTFTVGLNVNF